MQMVINLAPASLSNKKVNFDICPRLTFLKKKNATENGYKSISEQGGWTFTRPVSEAVDFKMFWGGRGGGACPQPP